MIVMPADHVIEPPRRFARPSGPRSRSSTTTRAPWSPSASSPLTPRPATATSSAARCWKPAAESLSTASIQFREKPDRATAEQFLAAGNFAWNAGIFVWRARTILDELQKHTAEPGERARADLRVAGHAGRGRDAGAAFPVARARTDRQGRHGARPERARARGPLSSGTTSATGARWPRLLERDSAGNAIQGDVVARDTTNSIIISDDGGLVATLGVDDLVIVHSGKATLVARKDQLDKLKSLVEGLVEAGYGSYL